MEPITCKKCGSIDDYNVVPSGAHQKAVCNGCGAYIKFLPQNKPVTEIYFGKYKGRLIAEMNTKDEVDYLRWCLKNMDLKLNIQEAFQKQINRK